MVPVDIILCSSNASEEYVIDILEAVGRPRGSVLHFRYRKKWVADGLWNLLPIIGKRTEHVLRSARVLVAYVCQRKTQAQQPQWITAYPVRLATLRDCYRTGDDYHDVAYFYFEMNEYCEVGQANQLSSLIQSRLTGRGPNEQYFAAGVKDFLVYESKDTDESAFYATSQMFDMDHFASPDGDIHYNPVFLQFSGLFTDSSKLEPQYNEIAREERYFLTEGSEYWLRANVRLRQLPASNSKVILTSHSDQFLTSEDEERLLASKYDVLQWQIVPKSVYNDVPSTVELSSRILFKRDDSRMSSAIDVLYRIPVVIEFDRQKRFREVFSDLSLASATFIIAVVGLIQNITDGSATTILSILAVIAAIAFLVGAIAKAIAHYHYKEGG